MNSNDPPVLPDATPEPADMLRAAPPAASPAPAAVAPAHETLALQLAREFLDDRRRERRWRIAFRLAWLLLALAFLLTLWAEQHPAAVHGTPHTALVEVHGEIGVGTEAGAEVLVAALKNAFADEGARAVVLRFNSPGGSPVQAGIVYDEILRLKALHKKPVYAVVEDLCASAAYYIAAAADHIYVDKASMVGSIGVLIDDFGFDGLMGKLGVERRLITAGEHKGLLDPFSPLSPQQRELAQSMIDEVHQQFIAAVREGRGKRLKEDSQTFSGMVWNGARAVEMGLADDLGNLDHVAREVVGAEDVIDYTPHENVAERLAKRFGAALGEGAVKALRRTPEYK
ncbi:protease-4 [Inhella inkyongensis]|uniref:Protease-4 n=1 Tax=Inhella inkyongensis TaxID=392593 RepID=A0A840S4J0_9BURK|nr:S49 family peptidase [Inhella inkyongensis]MBB5204378.1 protease-4 [Inhella inkyongensis]